MGRVSQAVSAMPVLALAACATMSVSADVDPRADFSSYRTYSWDPAHVDPTDDPRLENDPIFDSRVRSLVGDGLVARRLTVISPDSADLLIHYHVSVRQRVEVYSVDSEYGYDYYEEEDRLYEYEQGTLVLCVVEQQTSQIVWRGWVQADVDGVLDDPELMEKRLAEAVRKVLEKFPLPAGEG